MTNASVKPALEKIQNDLEEIKEMVQNGNGNLIQEKSNEPTEEADCLCNDTKKVLDENEEAEIEE